MLALLQPLVTLSAGTVSALGRVHPVSRVLNSTAPAGYLVTEVSVEEGDWVQPGQVLARFSAYQGRLQQLDSARKSLEGQKAKRRIELELNQIDIERIEKEVDIARNQLDQVLNSETAQFAAPDLLIQRELDWIRASSQLASARAQTGILEISADAAIREATAEVADAQSNLNAAQVVAPLEARVLKRLIQPGMTTSGSELFKLGDTRQMIVVAEVYESDVDQIREGQPAKISSPALDEPITGVVHSRGHMIFKDTVDSMDPTALTNARVVEVVILLDQPEPVQNLVFLQVDVEIDI
jgi:HlyD family secretion protein